MNKEIFIASEKLTVETLMAALSKFPPQQFIYATTETVADEEDFDSILLLGDDDSLSLTVGLPY